MHRIDHETATGDGLFTEGDALSETPPTTLTADWANTVQEEIVNAVETIMPLEDARKNQLGLALRYHAELLALGMLGNKHATNYLQQKDAASDDGLTLIAIRPETGENILYSTDLGKNWELVTMHEESGLHTPQAIEHANGLWVIVGDNGGIYTSTTGASPSLVDDWPQRAPATGYDKPFVAVHYCEQLSLWIAVGQARDADSPLELQTSPDGITWSQRTLPDTDQQYIEHYETFIGSRGSRIVVVAAGEAFTSSNGITWSSIVFDQPAYSVGDTPHGLMVVSSTNTGGVLIGYLLNEEGAWGEVQMPLGEVYNVRPDPFSGMLVGSHGTKLFVATPPYTQRRSIIARGNTGGELLKRTKRAWIAVDGLQDYWTSGPLVFR
jgi:hypothetical protein